MASLFVSPLDPAEVVRFAGVCVALAVATEAARDESNGVDVPLVVADDWAALAAARDGLARWADAFPESVRGHLFHARAAARRGDVDGVVNLLGREGVLDDAGSISPVVAWSWGDRAAREVCGAALDGCLVDVSVAALAPFDARVLPVSWARPGV